MAIIDRNGKPLPKSREAAPPGRITISKPSRFGSGRTFRRSLPNPFGSSRGRTKSPYMYRRRKTGRLVRRERPYLSKGTA